MGFPLLLIGWVGVILLLITTGAILYKNFENSYQHRLESVKSDAEFHKKYCVDNEKDVLKFGMADTCHERKHNSERDPVKHALIDAFEGASLCGKSGCDSLFGAMERPLELVLAILVMALVLTCMCGLKLFDHRANVVDYSLLPTTTANPITLEKKVD